MALESAPAAYFLFCNVTREGAEPERIRGPDVTADESPKDAVARFVAGTMFLEMFREMPRQMLENTDARSQEEAIKLERFLAYCAYPDRLGDPDWRVISVCLRLPSLELEFECHRAAVFDRWQDLALYNYSEEVKKHRES